MKADDFDLMIGRLDRSISEMMVAAKEPGITPADRQTLKHHAEDVIAAGERVLELHREWKAKTGDASESPPSGQVASIAAARAARDDPDSLVEFKPTISFEARAAECQAEGCNDFVLGFEAGLLYARLEGKPKEWNGTYHSSNVDMLVRVANAAQYVANVEPSGDPTWAFINFVPAPPVRHLAPVPTPAE